MNKIIFLSVLGLVAATELGLEGLKPSELKEIEKEIAAGNVPPNYTAEKPKRGVVKLTNADGPNFNHLSSPPKAAYNPQATYSSAPQNYAQPAYTSSPVYNQAQAAYTPGQVPYSSPVRYLYNNQYYPSNQYLSYLQNPQIASQLAAQYQYQPAAPHYVQTPTQIQYVSPPNYQNVPSAQFKALTSKAPVVSSTASQTQPQANQATSQVVLPSNMAAGPVYQQPQYVMYLISPQQQQAILAQQQQQHSYLMYPGQQQMILVGAQNPLLSLYSNPHRFSLPYSSPTTQLAYLTAAAQQQQQQQYQTLQPAVQQSSAADSAPKQAINVQETASSSNTYGLRTKA